MASAGVKIAVKTLFGVVPPDLQRTDPPQKLSYLDYIVRVSDIARVGLLDVQRASLTR